jgi:hypothetical protein
MGTVLLMRRRRMRVAEGAGRLIGRPRGRPGGPDGPMASSDLTLNRLPLSGRSR